MASRVAELPGGGFCESGGPGPLHGFQPAAESVKQLWFLDGALNLSAPVIRLFVSKKEKNKFQCHSLFL